MKSIITFLLIILSVGRLYSQHLDWINNIGIKEYAAGISGPIIDNKGNIILIGFFSDTIDLDCSPAEATLIPVGKQDFFIAKYRFNGDYVWSKSFGSADQMNVLNSVGIDSIGNIFIAGSFYNTIDFDPSSAIANLTSVGTGDIFIAKYDSLGNYRWARQFGSNLMDSGPSIAIDAIGNCYLTGTVYNTVALGGPPKSKILISKYDSTGIVKWSKIVGDNSYNMAGGISVNNMNQVIVTGSYSETLNLNNGNSNGQFTSFGGFDFFLSSFDVNGNFNWGKAFGNYLDNFAPGVTTDNLGNILIAGSYSNFLNFGKNAKQSGVQITSFNSYVDGYLAKFNNTGTPIFAKSIGGKGSDFVGSVTTDLYGNIFLKGTFDSTFYLDSSKYILKSRGGKDGFVVKYNYNGQLQFYFTTGGFKDDYLNSIVVNTKSDIYRNDIFLSGSYTDTLFANPDDPTDYISHPSSEVFFAHYYEDYSGKVPNKICGNVYKTNDNNCLKNAGENGLSGIIIRDTSGIYYTITDSLGNYVLYLDTGSVVLEQSIPMNLQLKPANCSAIQEQVFFPSWGNTSCGVNWVDTIQVITNVKSQGLFNNTFMLYPNPAKGTINIVCSDLLKVSSVTLNIYDSFGRLKLKYTLTQASKDDIIKLDVDLLPGVYSLILTNDKNFVGSLKLVIE